MAEKKAGGAAKQGQLDGACGFYAITNAIHLLEPELDRDEVFRCVWKSFLDDGGDPMRLVDGTNRGSIKNVLSRTLHSLNNDYDRDGSPYQLAFKMPYWKAKPATRAEVLSHLGKTGCINSTVAMIGYSYSDLEKEYHHWTVIKALKDDALYTFDSDNEGKKIFLDAVRFDDARKGSHISRPYNINSRDLFLVIRQSV